MVLSFNVSGVYLNIYRQARYTAVYWYNCKILEGIVPNLSPTLLEQHHNARIG